MLGAWIPLLEFLNLDPTGNVVIVVGGVCARAAAASEAEATVTMSDGIASVWAAREAVASVTMGDGTATSGVPGC